MFAFYSLVYVTLILIRHYNDSLSLDGQQARLEGEEDGFQILLLRLKMLWNKFSFGIWMKRSLFYIHFSQDPLPRETIRYGLF